MREPTTVVIAIAFRFTTIAAVTTIRSKLITIINLAIIDYSISFSSTIAIAIVIIVDQLKIVVIIVIANHL